MVLCMVLSACDGGDALTAGKALMVKGQYAEAAAELKDAVDEAPDSREARMLLSDALERSNDFEAAEHHLRSVLNGDKDPSALAPRAALFLLDRNQPQALIREFKEVSLFAPEADANLRATVAMAHIMLGQLPQARAHLGDAPLKTPLVALALAQAWLAEGKGAQMQAELTSARQAMRMPGWWATRGIGRLESLNGDVAAAQASFKQASDIAPWHWGLLGEYGDALLAGGKVAEASAIRDRLKQANPDHLWTRSLSASLLARANRSEDSLVAALEVLATAADHLPAILVAAAAEIKMGDLMVASRHLTAALKAQPGSLQAMALLAQVQLQSKQSEPALATIRRALAQAPQDRRFVSLNAEAQALLGNHKEEEAALLRLVDLAPADPADSIRDLERLAELKSKLGDKTECAKWMTRAAELALKSQPERMATLVATALRLRELPLARNLADRGVAAWPDQPQARMSLASVQAAQQDAAGAFASTLAALDKQPTLGPALTALSALARKPAEHAELMARYAKAVTMPGAPDSSFVEYGLLLRQSANDQAGETALLEKGLRALPGSVGLRASLIQAYFRTGQHDKALDLAQAGAALPNAPNEALALLAGTAERLGKFELASGSYRQLTAAAPHRTDWKLRHIDALTAEGLSGDAISALRALISARPFEAAAYVALVDLFLADRPIEALATARQMAAREELKLEGMILVGDVLAQTKDDKEALAQYDRAIKAGAMPKAALRRVTLLDAMAMRDIADREMNELVQQFTKEPQVFALAAQRAFTNAQNGGGNAQASSQAAGQQWAQRAEQLVANDAAALNELAGMLLRAKRPEAVDSARRASLIQPDNPKVLDTLGSALLQAGKASESVTVLRGAAQLAPAEWAIQLHLAQAMLAARDRDGAKAIASKVPVEQLRKDDKDLYKSLKSSLKG